MISTESVAYAYGSSQRMIKYPNISLDKGEMMAVLGKSGSGKTTFLHLLAGILTPSQGSVFIDQKDLSKLTRVEKDKFRGRKIGLVFQKPIFAAALNAVQNLELASYLSNVSFDQTWSKQVMDTLGIAHLMDKKIYNMSVGEQQRLSIARAMVNKPTIVLADEPTSALDDSNAAQVLNLLSTLCSQFQTSLVVVTHDNRVSGSIKNKFNYEHLLLFY